MYKTAGLLTAALSSVAAAEWTVQDGTTATMVLGVGVSSDVYTVAAAAQNGVGAEMESFDGKDWSKEYLPAGSLMDAAASGQVSVGVSMWEVLLSTDGGSTYTVADNVKGLSQSCSVFGDGSDLGLVGSFTAASDIRPVSGVAHSTDAGATWSVSEVPVGMVRYGSFPSKDTWYVTSGMWGDSAATREAATRLSARVTVGAGGAAVRMDHELKMPSNATLTDENGWWGAISKTTDAGKTWETVFHSQPSDVYYFNGISCSSDTHCVAVAEGAVYVAFVTTDGGATWKETFNSAGNAPDNMVSLMGAAWEDDSVGWVAGTSKDGHVLTGLFYKTTDGGSTYSLEQSLDNCFPIDMDFEGSTGAAACLSSSGSSGYAAMYL